MKNHVSQQVVPLILTVLTFLLLFVFLFVFIQILNFFPLKEKIIPRIHVADIIVGLTIYIKTSVDFALFIGNLMSKNSGIKSRVAIEIGTALGNAVGTAMVLLVWTFFKEVPFLMIIMIFLASLVLLQMAEESIEELLIESKNKFFYSVYKLLHFINTPLSPIAHIVLPKKNTSFAAKNSFFSLLFFAFTIPLILGLDDFAGYIPLFNIVNVFGFAVGVFLGHMILNIALFASPQTTITLVKKPIVAFLGSAAFVGIALWGFVEIWRLLQHIV